MGMVGDDARRQQRRRRPRSRSGGFFAATTPRVRATGPLAVMALLMLLVQEAPLATAAPLQCAAQSSQAAGPPTPDSACVCVDGWTGAC
jgi:hypothetical protein